jgi:UDP-N-acetylglucosamine:LPS N-acetylglucosamine transferase
MLLRPALRGYKIFYLTTLEGLSEQSEAQPAYVVPDCNRNKKVAILRSAIAIFCVILRVRPDVVLTTGALPGLIALALGKISGARTVWVDSVANAEKMSLAGFQARKYADLWLTQWPEVANSTGAEYAGSVL